MLSLCVWPLSLVMGAYLLDRGQRYVSLKGIILSPPSLCVLLIVSEQLCAAMPS